MDEQVDVVVLSFEVSAERAAAELARVFGLGAQEARAFVDGVPRAAKHATSQALGERYAEALQAIGARVELRPVQTASSGRPSLPEPSAQKDVDLLQLGIEDSEENVIERFRHARGVSPSMDPAREAAAYEERIPRAPALPRDMDRMPNAILPRWSARPTDDKPVYSAAPPRGHSNADMPPAFSFSDEEEAGAPGATPDATQQSAPQSPATSPRRSGSRATPAKAPLGRTPAASAVSERSTRRFSLPIAAALAAVAALLLWLALR